MSEFRGEMCIVAEIGVAVQYDARTRTEVADVQKYEIRAAVLFPFRRKP